MKKIGRKIFDIYIDNILLYNSNSISWYIYGIRINRFDLIIGVLTPLPTIFQLYHGDQV
jgi:hypothetical protein